LSERLRVGVSADLRESAGQVLGPVLAHHFDPLPHVEYEYMQEYKGHVTADQIIDYDAVITLRPRYDAMSLRGVDRLAVIARWGVGYDMIDVPACTDANVVLAINRDAVRRPVAEAIVTLVLALARRLPVKDRVVREGRWDLRGAHPGLGLRGKIMGSVGLGNIGAELFRLLQPFGLARRLAFDPYVSQEEAASLDVELVDLDTLFKNSDFVAINCPLNDHTRGLVDAHLLGLMKPTAYLINTARGAIVKQDDLVEVLRARRIGGAGLDVFDPEPLPADHPLTKMDNVILSPHSLAWTDHIYMDNSVGACQSVLSVFSGEMPTYSVNREVADRRGFQEKLRALKERSGSPDR